MSDLDNRVVIDSVSANIINENSQDKAILVGVFSYENSTYSENLELVIKPEVGYPLKIKLNYTGYDMQLFCGDFTNDKKDEIMVRGSFGGSGGYEIGVIYKLENNQIKELFNQNDISKNSPCSAVFKNNYKDMTGSNIDTSLAFLKLCQEMNKKLWIRVVIIPGINDTKEYINELIDFIKPLKNVEKIEFLPYHTLGVHKYDKLGIKYPLKDIPDMDKDKCKELENMLKEGLTN